MFNLNKRLLLAFLLNIQLNSSLTYNVALNQPTQLLAGQIVYSDQNGQSVLSHANDGITTFWELNSAGNGPQYNNWSLYMIVLKKGQTQVIDFGSSKTQLCYGTKIYIGNDKIGGPNSSLNKLCTTLIATNINQKYNVYSQWISCPAIQGQFLWIQTANQDCHFSEIMVYEFDFVQTNSLSVKASINQTNIMLPFQKINPIVANQCITNSSAPGGFNNYCYISNFESQPTIDIQLRANANLLAIIFLPLLETLKPIDSSLFSNNVSIQVFSFNNWVSCPMIINSNQQPESDCGGISANQIKIQRNCQSNSCQMGLCSIGILTDCNCSNTQFLKSMMAPQFYNETKNLIISNTTNFTLTIGDPLVTYNLTNIKLFADTTSLVCGDSSGINFCGSRTLSLWEIWDGEEVIINNSTLISINQTLLQLNIGTNSLQDAGHHVFILKVSLQNYPQAGYFPQQTLFLVNVQCKSFEIVPVSNLTTFVYTIGSGNQTFSVANYQQTPAECSQNITTIQAKLQTLTQGVPSIIDIDVSNLQFQFNVSELSLANSDATYLINATFQTVNNLGSIFIMQFQKGEELTPYLESPLQIPQNIPCLDQLSDLQKWSYVFPQAQDPQQKPLDFNFKCPKLPEIFNQTLESTVLTLRIKNSPESTLKLITKGNKNCQLSISNGVQTAAFSLSFNFPCLKSVQQNIQTVDFQIKNTSTQNIVAPIPKIESISNRGIMIISWNVEMDNNSFSFKNVTFNQTIQKGRLLKQISQKNPLLVQIQPVMIEDNPGNLQIDSYQIIYYEGNTLQVQLLFNNPGYISAISKDYLQVIFNPQYFISKDNAKIDLNKCVIQKIVPKQIVPGQLTVNLGQTSVGLLSTMATCTVLSIPSFQFFGNYILSIIDPLVVITHYILINLNFPANLQDFFSQIFPLIQYDVFQTSQLYQLIFTLDLINDGALSENFNNVGYTNILAINNIGSLLILIVIQPISLALLFLFQRLLKSKNNFIAKIIYQSVQSKLQSLLWNGLIKFYFSSYLVLSMIGWISIYDVRFGFQFKATENFSSLLGIILVLFSIIFPVLILVIYKRGYRPYQESLEVLFKQQNQSKIIDDFLNEHESLEKYQNKTQTYQNRKKFMQKYGGLFDDLRTNRIGRINETIGFPIIILLSQIIVIIAVLGFIKIPVLAVFALIHNQNLQICYLLCYKPYKEKLDHYRDLFNLTAKLFLTYMLILFTNYVHISISISGGTQFLCVVLLIIGINIVIYPIQTIFGGIRFLKRFCKRCKMQRRKKNQAKQDQKNKILQQRKQVILQNFQKIGAFQVMEINEKPKNLQNRNPSQTLLNSKLLVDENNDKDFMEEEQKQPKLEEMDKFINLKAQQQNSFTFIPQITKIQPTKTQNSQFNLTLNQPTNKVLEISNQLSSYQDLYQNSSNSSINSSLEELKVYQSIKNVLNQGPCLTEWNNYTQNIDIASQDYQLAVQQQHFRQRDEKLSKENIAHRSLHIFEIPLPSSMALTVARKPNQFQQNWQNNYSTGLSDVRNAMTDVSRWQRHWDYSFKSSSNNYRVNKLEADTYIQYLKSRKVILQWDKPPKFTNQTLSQECSDAYNERIVELYNEQRNISEINDQREQLRKLVAKMLYEEPFIDDLKSRKELSKEISFVRLEQFEYQSSLWK